MLRSGYVYAKIGVPTILFGSFMFSITASVAWLVLVAVGIGGWWVSSSLDFMLCQNS